MKFEFGERWRMRRANLAVDGPNDPAAATSRSWRIEWPMTADLAGGSG